MEAAFQLGMAALDQDGRRVGTVEDVLYDQQGAARYLVIRDNGVFSTDVVLSTGAATVAGNSAKIALSAEQIHAAPRFDATHYGAGAGLTSAAVERYSRQDEE